MHCKLQLSKHSISGKLMALIVPPDSYTVHSLLTYLLGSSKSGPCEVGRWGGRLGFKKIIVFWLSELIREDKGMWRPFLASQNFYLEKNAPLLKIRSDLPALQCMYTVP